MNKIAQWHVQASTATTGSGIYDGLKWVADQLKP